MKQIFLFIFPLLLPFGLYAQDLPKVEGLGKFKLGTTDTSIMDELCKELGTAIVRQSSPNVESLREEDKIIEIVYDSSNCKSGFTSYTYSNRVRVFQVFGYNLLDKYKLNLLDLAFFDGVLYRITAVNAPITLSYDLDLKYGKPELELKNNKCFCSVGAESFNMECKTYYQKWTNGNVNLSYVISEDRKRNGCEKENKTFIYGRHEKLARSAKELNDAGEKKCEEIIRKAKLKNLDGL